jgi:hypothetical protein
MNYQIMNEDPKRYAKREKGIRAKAEKFNASEIEKQISGLEDLLKDDRDEDAPECPGLMINTILWDAMVEALQIWKKIQAERVK